MSKKNFAKGVALTAAVATVSACVMPVSAIHAKEQKIVELKAITMGVMPGAGNGTFYKQLDKMTKKDLNCTVRFDYIPWGDEKNRINLAIASGQYDLYCGGGWSDYKSMAAKNAFMDLKPLLKNVPNLVKHYTINGIDNLKYCEIDGNLYGIPQFSKSGPKGGGEGFLYREDLRKKWGLKPVTSLQTMEAYLYRAHKDPQFKNASLLTDNRIWTSLFWTIANNKYMPVEDLNTTPYAVCTFKDPYKVVSLVDTPEYRKILLYAEKWYKAGIIDHDILAASGNETVKASELLKAGKKPCETNSPMWSISDVIDTSYKAHGKNWEWGWFDYIKTNSSPTYLAAISTNTVISIAAKCKNAVTALKLIEKVHTDKSYYMLLRNGVNGENYNLVNGQVDKGKIKSENLRAAWTGSPDQYMDPLAAKSIDSRWQAITDKIQNTGAKPTQFNPLEGFNFDKSGLSAESAGIETVRSQYMLPLECGVTKNMGADLNTIKSKLKSAGLNKYLSELQKQLTDFGKKRK